jgi:hypothetical protein
MNSNADLRLDWCSFKAASFACRHWHYSRSLPAAKRVQIGCWEDGHFVGAIVFSRGACPNIAAAFGLTQTAVCELTRVALGQHETPTSRIVAIALRMLRRQSPGVKLIVSYADPQHGHHGGIYQALNFLYVGLTHREACLRVGGLVLHARTVSSRYGSRSVAWLREHVDPHAERIVFPAKHKYVFPFDAAVREQIQRHVQPYPRRERANEVLISGTAAPTAGGGAHPTRSLQQMQA